MSADKMRTRAARRQPKPPEPPGGKGASGRRTRQDVQAEPQAQGDFRPSLLFVVATFVVAGGGAFAVGGTSPANIVFVARAIGPAGAAAFLLYRSIWPLVGPSTVEGPDMLGGRTRAALEREKAAVLRAIKELEFDRAMKKISDDGFHEMATRLRGRAAGGLRQLDGGAGRRAGTRPIWSPER